jgi:hypothetical protein
MKRSTLIIFLTTLIIFISISKIYGTSTTNPRLIWDFDVTGVVNDVDISLANSSHA